MDDLSKTGYNAESQGGPTDPEPQPTIVGGRPGGKGRGSAVIPVGIQVLVKKAAVDSEFRTLLLEERSRAADRIGLELTPAEIATVNSVPKAQLEKIIEHTKVPDEQRRVFLGYLGAAMVALIGVGPAGCIVLTGIRPASPPEPWPRPLGIEPDLPVNRGSESEPGSKTRDSEWPTRGARPDRPDKGDGPARKPEKGVVPEELPSTDKKK